MKAILPISLMMVASIAWAANPTAPQPREIPKLQLVQSTPIQPPLVQRGSLVRVSWRPGTTATYFGG